MRGHPTELMVGFGTVFGDSGEGSGSGALLWIGRCQEAEVLL